MVLGTLSLKFFFTSLVPNESEMWPSEENIVKALW